MERPLEEIILAHTLETNFNQFNETTIRRAKLFILDTISCMVAGSSAPGCKELVEIFNELGGKPESTILVYGYKLPSIHAAYANSAMAHALELDDVHDPTILHTCNIILSAALATAESIERVNGRELLTSVILGVDTMCRLGLGVRVGRGWNRPSIYGVLGAVAAISRLLKLTKAELHNALGIAYTQACGNSQSNRDGALVKRMMPGNAARASLLAASMAKKGITGPKQFLEGKFGLYNLYERGSEIDRKAIVQDLGESFEIVNLSMKRFPSCRGTHAAVNSALELAKSHDFSEEEIEGINILVSPYVLDLVGGPYEQKGQVAAQFNLYYTVAAAITRKDLFLKEFEEDCLTDPRIKRLITKIHIQPFKEVNETSLGEFELFPAEVQIRTVNGKVHTHRTERETIKGGPDFPMDFNDCIERLRKCASYSARPIDENRLNSLATLIKDLDHLENIEAIPSLLSPNNS